VDREYLAAILDMVRVTLTGAKINLLEGFSWSVKKGASEGGATAPANAIPIAVKPGRAGSRRADWWGIGRAELYTVVRLATRHAYHGLLSQNSRDVRRPRFSDPFSIRIGNILEKPIRNES
jgi:hypothetical protein